MKKILSFFMVGFLLVGCSENRENKTDLEKKGLLGEIKSLTESVFTTIEKFGEIQKDSLDWKYIFKYDKSGNGTEEAHYNSDGSLGWYYISKHDGNEIENAMYTSDSSLEMKSITKYDGSGNNTDWAKYKPDGSLDWKETYKYDGSGNKTEEARFNSDGYLDYKYIYMYEYDSKVNWTKSIKSEVKSIITKATGITEREIEYYDEFK